MTIRSRHALVAASICLLLAVPLTQAQAPTPDGKETSVTNRATGPFDVKTSPQNDKLDDPLLGRFALDKQYHGDLEAAGKGQMLTAGTAVKGSAAYVALEKVTGSLKGRAGTFVLQHAGSMSGGNLHLNVTAVPDSGTGQLAGIRGTMKIAIAPDGKHSYDIEYTLPKSE